MLATTSEGFIGLVLPYDYLTWLVGGFHWTMWILIRVWSINWFVENLPSVYIFIRCTVQHLQYLIARLYAISSQDSLGIRRYRCACGFLGILGDLNWNTLGVTWFPQLVPLQGCLACLRHLNKSEGLNFLL